MHNLSTVINFEIMRSLKKKSFWIMALAFPLMIAAIFGVIFLSNKSTGDAVEKLKSQRFSLVITDDSKLVHPSLISQFGAKTTTDKQAAINDVKRGTIDAYIYYPADLAKQRVEVYGKDVGLFDNGRYSEVAKMLLAVSIQTTIPESTQSIIKGKLPITSTTYRGGVEYDPIKQMILPGIFVVLFYLLISFFGNQMLTSTTEEKENRVTEMILTTIEARTLIIGKIVSLVALALIQAVVIIAPVLIGYLLFRTQLHLPIVDLSSLPVDWVRISLGFVLFFTSFMLFTGLLVLIGSAVPTAKEASGFMGLVFMLIFGPLYAVTLFISMPDSPLVRGLSLFPFTAPIPLLLRNAVGNLQPWEIAIALPVMIVTAIIILALAVRIFRYGALEYDRKVSLRTLFGKR